MINLFKKKQAIEPARPVDKSKAIPGFTKAIKQFAKAQEKMEPDFIPIYLYVMDKKTNNYVFRTIPVQCSGDTRSLFCG